MEQNLVKQGAGNGLQTPKLGRWRVSSFWWLVTAFWLVILLASTLERSLLQSASLEQALLISLSRLAPWILLSPLVVWVSSVYTIERSSWKRSLWMHLALCALCLSAVGLFRYLGPPSHARAEPASPSAAERDDRETAFAVLKKVTFQLPVFCGLVGVAHAVRFYERNKARERREVDLESRLAKTRLQALRTQLSPHFMFNTLNSIGASVREQPKAREMIDALSDLLRLTFSACDHQEIPLREELHLLDRYLFIERARLGDRLRIEKQIDVGALDALVPTLILQPLIENAVKHGIEPRVNPGTIRLAVERSEKGLLLTVKDNCQRPEEKIGAEAAPPTTEAAVKEGLGLGNTRSRLKELYGADAGLMLRRGKTGGFCAQIQLPLRSTMQAWAG